MGEFIYIRKLFTQDLRDGKQIAFPREPAEKFFNFMYWQEGTQPRQVAFTFIPRDNSLSEYANQVFTTRLYAAGTKEARMDGEVKAFLRDKLHAEVDDYVEFRKRNDNAYTFDFISRKSARASLYEAFCENRSFHTLILPYASEESKTKLPRQLIVYGAPGTGKSWRIKSDTKGMSVIRTTFHPDSDYSTFVGAYKPSMEDDDFKTVVMTGEIGSAGNITKKDGLVTKKRIVYSFRSQAFLDAYVAAWRKCAAYLAATDEDSAKKATQFLVIEEINRGNCAQIFGDIFQLLDREDDGYSSYAIDADSDLKKFLADSFKGDTAKGIPALDLAGVDLGDRDITPNEISSGDKLLLPLNLYIWATMNTSDQSLFPIDSAFKRRWAWKYIPISNAGKNYSIEVGGDKYDWWTFLEKANDLVQSFTESEDKKLGYFFCKADRNGVISLEQFVGKVVFYLWNGVFKDTGFDDEVFDDGKGGKLYFKRFFDAKGDPNPESVRQFMKNLGVGAVASSAGNAEGADEGATTEPPAGDAENMEGQGQ